VSHFRPFGKIDVFYISESDFKPTAWYGLPTKVLYDPNCIVADVISRSKGLCLEIATDEVDRSISKGITSAHEAYRRIHRVDLFFAQSLLDSLRHYMIQADDWINSRPPQAVTFSMLEQRGSNTIIQSFSNAYVELYDQEIEKALKVLLGAFRQKVVCLHTQFKLSRSLENDLEAIDTIA